MMPSPIENAPSRVKTKDEVLKTHARFGLSFLLLFREKKEKKVGVQESRCLAVLTQGKLTANRKIMRCKAPVV